MERKGVKPGVPLINGTSGEEFSSSFSFSSTSCMLVVLG